MVERSENINPLPFDAAQNDVVDIKAAFTKQT